MTQRGMILVVVLLILQLLSLLGIFGLTLSRTSQLQSDRLWEQSQLQQQAMVISAWY